MADQQRQVSKPDFNVYALDGEGRNAFWLKIGAAWKHRDGKEGFNIQLQALPLNSRLVLLPPKDQGEEGSQPADGEAAAA